MRGRKKITQWDLLHNISEKEKKVQCMTNKLRSRITSPVVLCHQCAFHSGSKYERTLQIRLTLYLTHHQNLKRKQTICPLTWLFFNVSKGGFKRVGTGSEEGRKS